MSIDLKNALTWLYNGVELVEHEIDAVWAFVDGLTKSRAVIDLANLTPQTKAAWGYVELADDELTRIKNFVAGVREQTERERSGAQDVLNELAVKANAG